MKDWDTPALEFVERHLGDKDYGFGDGLIRTTLVTWANFITSAKLGQGLSYRDTYAVKDSTGRAEPPTCMIDSLVTDPREPRRDPILSGLAAEWVFRFWQHYDRVKADRVERFPLPTVLTSRETIIQLIEPVREDFMAILKPLSLDDGLDFMASLAVAWARRFNTTGFFELVQAAGYIVPTTDKDNFAAATALWFIEIYFE